MIPEADDPEGKNYLECLKTEGSASYEEEFCNIKHAGIDQVNEKILCLDSKNLKSKEICDLKYSVNADKESNPVDLKQCYKDAGYTLDKAFCQQFYQDLDQKYECYK